MPQMNPMNWLLIFLFLLFSVLLIWTNMWFKKNFNPSSTFNSNTPYIKFNPLW